VKKENQIMPDTRTKQEEKPAKRNDIKEIRSLRQLQNVNLDLDSPRMRQAIDNLGVSETELMKK
jgi:hypothetical protein